jgi:hypothetical protein
MLHSRPVEIAQVEIGGVIKVTEESVLWISRIAKPYDVWIAGVEGIIPASCIAGARCLMHLFILDWCRLGRTGFFI